MKFVCIARPIERATGSGGGPLVYRITHHVPKWSAGEEPTLERRDLEGTPPLLA